MMKYTPKKFLGLPADGVCLFTTSPDQLHALAIFILLCLMTVLYLFALVIRIYHVPSRLLTLVNLDAVIEVDTYTN
jgi:hypothetical protein